MGRHRSRGFVFSMVVLASLCLSVSGASKFRLAFGANFKYNFVTDDLKIVSSIGNKVPDVLVWLGDIHDENMTPHIISGWKQHLRSDVQVLL